MSRLISLTGILKRFRSLNFDKMFPTVFLIATFILGCHAAVGKNIELLNSLRRECVVPDVIDKIPPSILEVKYGYTRNPDSIVAVHYGNLIRKNITQDKPTFISLEDANPAKSYFLVMIDPDPPTKALPFLGHILHYMVANIPGSDMNSGGETIVEYTPPNPPILSGAHRFVYLMYEQPHTKMHFDKRDVPIGSRYSRLRFKTKKFTDKYNLGNAVAANFFKTKY